MKAQVHQSFISTVSIIRVVPVSFHYVGLHNLGSWSEGVFHSEHFTPRDEAAEEEETLERRYKYIRKYRGHCCRLDTLAEKRGLILWISSFPNASFR